MPVAPDTLLPAALLRKLDRVRLSARRSHDMRIGEQVSRQHGHGLDFADFREYQPGDDFRHIDWNSYSRLDRLFVRVFAEEQSLSLDLCLDTSRSMHTGAPAKLGYAQQLAAAIGYIALRGGVHTAVADLQNPAPALPLRDRRHVGRLCAFLAQCQAEGPTELGPALRRRAVERARPGLCLVLSDLLDAQDWQAAVLALVAQRKEVHLLHVVSTEDLEPAQSGQLALIDSESRARLALSVDDVVLGTYRQIAAAWLDEIRAFARKHGVGYHLLSTGQSLDALLLGQLRRGGLLA